LLFFALGIHASSVSEENEMKTNKAIVALLVVAALWLSLVLGCSRLKSGISSSSSGGTADKSDYFPLRVGDSWKYRSTTADGKQSEFTIKVLSEEKENGNPL